jgi:hypothetical protein
MHEALLHICFYTYLDVEFLLSGQLYPNNSLVTLDGISILYCLTPSTECCGSSVSGEWYFPGGAAVSSSTRIFRRSQVPSAVSLRRSSGTPPTGVYRCEIPDASGTSQSIYVGIYPQGDGKIRSHIENDNYYHLGQRLSSHLNFLNEAYF